MFILSENRHIGSEDDLVQLFIEKYSQKHLMFTDWQMFTMYTEVRIPEIGRRSDVVLYTDHKKVINIEFKLTDSAGVFKQAKDHKKWADYSVVCMPANVFSYQTSHWLTQFMKEGIGILLYANGTFIEIMKPYHSTHTGGKDKRIRTNVLSRLNSPEMKLQLDTSENPELPKGMILPLIQEGKIVGKAKIELGSGGAKAKLIFNKSWKTRDRQFDLKLEFSGEVNEQGQPKVKGLSLNFKARW